jgi:ABC-type sugar transport system ATPase subunit
MYYKGAMSFGREPPGQPGAEGAWPASDGHRARTLTAQEANTSRFGIGKATHDYAGVVVLRDVDLEISAGTVHGLVGENGSGKSTLIKILSGAMAPRYGELYLDDQVITLSSPGDAQRRGIGVVHQDYNLFPDLSVADNVFGVGKAPPHRKLFPLAVDKRKVRRMVWETLTSLGVSLSPDALIRTLDAAERKFVEIARAMLLQPRFLILDEPTASLEPQGAESVLALLGRLRARGVGMAFVSHRLDEVLKISDCVTVLRDGARVTCEPNTGLTEDRLAELILGYKHVARRSSAGGVGEDELVTVTDLEVDPKAAPVNFSVRRGEIFGLTGLLGSGAARVVRMLGGAEPMRGSLKIDGVRVRVSSPRDASRAGIGFVPEDRKALGLVADQSVAVNISLASLSAVATAGWLHLRELDRRATVYRERLDIRARSVRQPAKSLSGGNQQKVLLAKWLASKVRVLVIEEPTHGIDIGGKAQVHELLRQFAAEGGTIVVASTDIGEVLELCHRIGIMRHGALTEVLSTEELTHLDVALRGVKSVESVVESLVETGVAEEISETGVAGA